MSCIVSNVQPQLVTLGPQALHLDLSSEGQTLTGNVVGLSSLQNLVNVYTT